MCRQKRVELGTNIWAEKLRPSLYLTKRVCWRTVPRKLSDKKKLHCSFFCFLACLAYDLRGISSGFSYVNFSTRKCGRLIPHQRWRFPCSWPARWQGLIRRGRRRTAPLPGSCSTAEEKWWCITTCKNMHINLSWSERPENYEPTSSLWSWYVQNKKGILSLIFGME